MTSTYGPIRRFRDGNLYSLSSNQEAVSLPEGNNCKTTSIRGPSAVGEHLLGDYPTVGSNGLESRTTKSEFFWVPNTPTASPTSTAVPTAPRANTNSTPPTKGQPLQTQGLAVGEVWPSLPAGARGQFSPPAPISGGAWGGGTEHRDDHW